jgi:hypothetical protein
LPSPIFDPAHMHFLVHVESALALRQQNEGMFRQEKGERGKHP